MGEVATGKRTGSSGMLLGEALLTELRSLLDGSLCPAVTTAERVDCGLGEATCTGVDGKIAAGAELVFATD